MHTHIPEELWCAIVRCDPAYDDKFLYAVRTTGIFCRPSCKSRMPIRGNVRLFHDANEAVSAGFRPCKRCKPADRHNPMEEWITRITQYIDKHYNEPITLERLSYACHGSPYHLQRTFKRIKGITPALYIQLTRISKAKELLVSTDMTVTEIGFAVGLPNVPYFITLFKKNAGFTPADFRKLHQPDSR